jgi:hypothetical protein
MNVRRCAVLALLLAGTVVMAQTDAPSQRIPGKVQASLQPDGTVQFYLVPDAPIASLPSPTSPGAKAQSGTFPSWIVDSSVFGASKGLAYKVTSDNGKFAGYWFGTETPESAFALQNAVSPGWSVEKVAAFDPKRTATQPQTIPLSRAEVTQSLQRELFAQAKEIACNSQVRPKEIKVAASLQATVGAVVVGGGSITFELLWEVQKLCQ